MHFASLALGTLLLATPLLSHGQTPISTSAAASPKFYVGLGAYSSYYQPLSTIGAAARVPLQLTAGYQLQPRLAVQVGLAYSGNSRSYNYEGLFYPISAPPGYYFTDQGTSTVRYYGTSVLARYTLTRKLQHRLQFDVLGGFELEHQAYRSHGIQTDSSSGTLNTTPYDTRTANTNLVLTVGPSVRYRFGQRVDLVYDLLFSTNVLSNNPYQIRGFTGGMALGLRYRFGKR